MKMRIIKYYKKAGIGFLAILLIGLFACTKKFDALNTPPDQITTKNLNANLLGQMFASSQYIGMYGLNGACRLVEPFRRSIGSIMVQM